MTLLALALGLQLAATAGGERTAIDRGRELYFANCASCHGADATGNGPDGDGLSRRPADLRRSTALRSSSDQDLLERILDGRRLRIEFDPVAVRLAAAESEALYRFLTRIAQVRWSEADAGREIYFSRCAVCHGWYGVPSGPLPKGLQKAPPQLADPAFQSSIGDAELRSLVRHGKAGMPALAPRLGEKDAAAVARFVRLLSPGYQLYDRYCVNCHGRHGEGAVGGLQEPGGPHTVFDGAYFRSRDPDQIHDAIWHMLREAKPSMPHFAGELTPAEARAIVAYLRSLQALP